jgi:predicted phage tail protein
MALNSTSVIKIVDLLCEGPIEGIVGNNKGVFLDETRQQQRRLFRRNGNPNGQLAQLSC